MDQVGCLPLCKSPVTNHAGFASARIFSWRTWRIGGAVSRETPERELNKEKMGLFSRVIRNAQIVTEM
jgi:hypothetical protein